MLTELHRRLEQTTHPLVRQDLQILIKSLEDFTRTARLNQDNLLPYFNMSQTIFQGTRALIDPQVAKMPLPQWAAFLDRNPELKDDFEYEVMFLMSEVMAHTITLHLLDAPGRVRRFERKHPELAERIPKKELAAYLNLSAETLSRRNEAGGRRG